MSIHADGRTETDRQTDGRTDGRTDGQTDRQTDTHRETDGQTDRQTYICRYVHTYMHARSYKSAETLMVSAKTFDKHSLTCFRNQSASKGGIVTQLHTVFHSGAKFRNAKPSLGVTMGPETNPYK